METFPFSEAEWVVVQDAALPVVNAGLADDPVLRASHRVGLLDVLARLRARHGDHPVLLETQADFAEDEAEQVTLYRRAAGIAGANGLPTLGIRLSLVRVLLDSGEPGAALAELRACKGELAAGDESDRASWVHLAAEVRQAGPTTASDGGPGPA